MTLKGTCTNIYNTSKVNGQIVPKATAKVGSKYVNSVFTSSKKSTSTATSSATLLETLALIGTTIAPFAPSVISMLKGKNNNSDATQNNGAKNVVNQNTKSSADDLQKAITDCQNDGQVEALKSKVTADKTSQQQEAAEIAQMTDVQQRAYDTASGELTKLNESYDTAKNELTGLKETEKSAETEATQAVKAEGIAQTSYDKAALNLLNAERALASASPEQKAAAQAAVQTATTAKTTAETTLKTAKETTIAKNKAKAEAQSARKDKETAISEMKKNIEAKKAEVEKAKDALKAAQEKQKTAKAASEKWAATIQEAEATLAKYGETAETKKDSKSDSENSIKTLGDVNSNFRAYEKPATNNPFKAKTTWSTNS